MSKHHNSHETISTVGSCYLETENEQSEVIIENAKDKNAPNIEIGNEICVEQPHSSYLVETSAVQAHIEIANAENSILDTYQIENVNTSNITTDNQKIGNKYSVTNNELQIILHNVLHHFPQSLSLSTLPTITNSAQQSTAGNLQYTKHFPQLRDVPNVVNCENCMSSSSSSDESSALSVRQHRNLQDEECVDFSNLILQGVSAVITEDDRTHISSPLNNHEDSESIEQQTPVNELVEVAAQTEIGGSISSSYNRIPRGTFRESRLYRFYRSLLRSVASETSRLHQTSHHIHYPTPSLTRAPPTYSAILGYGEVDDDLTVTNRSTMGTQLSYPFIAPSPPPTYAEAQGFITDQSVTLFSIQQLLLTRDPVYINCPRCNVAILSRTRSEVTSMNHISALILFFCGCWPCCFIPYCTNTCKNTLHNCPNCGMLLGVYRPWSEWEPE